MATTAQNARLNPLITPNGAVIPVSASGIGGVTATQGDWAIASAQWAIPAHDATIGSPAFRISALGMFLENNPTFDHLGRAINNSAITVARQFVARVSAGNSGSARTIPLGSFAYPDTTASGIVGQTGATGVGPQWVTAPPVGISANPTGALASGVAIVINHPLGGDSGVGQIDIVVNLGTNAVHI